MRKWITGSVLLLACTGLAACSGTEAPAPAASASGFVEVPEVSGGASTEIPGEVLRFAEGMTDAMAWYFENPNVDFETFNAGFTALWLQTALNGVALERIPVAEFTETIVEPDGSNLPGINYFIEATFDGQAYCVADTQVLYVPDITNEEYQASRQPPSEYVALPGACESRILSAIEATTVGIDIPEGAPDDGFVEVDPAPQVTAPTQTAEPSAPPASPAP